MTASFSEMNLTEKHFFPAPPMVDIFFSYARIDFESPADRPILDRALQVILARIRQTVGDRNIRINRDIEMLAPGDDWRDEIFEGIEQSDLLIALVSPSWLRRPECGREFDAFFHRERDLAAPKRIIPIWLHDTSDPHLELNDQERARRETLRARQIADWRALLDSDEQERDRMSRDLGAAIGKRVLQIRNSRKASDSGQTKAGSDGPKAKDQVPLPVDYVPVVSGEYSVPGQDPRVFLRVKFAGLSELTLLEGRFVFRTRGALIRTSVAGGTLTDENDRFRYGGSHGEIAHVISVQASRSEHKLKLTAGADGLYGEPLADPVEGSDTMICGVERTDPELFEVRGDVVLLPEAVDFVSVEETEAVPVGEQQRARDAAIAKLAALLIEKHPAELPLEPFTSSGKRSDD